MTEQPQQAELNVLAVAQPGTRLEELLASYEGAKAAAEEAKARFEAITGGIKAELSAAHPKAVQVLLSGAPGLPRLRMTWSASWRVDTKRLKAEDPLTYVRYAVKGGHYELRQA